MVAAASPAACSDGAKKWDGKRNNGYLYYVNASTLPAGISQNQFESEIAYAHDIIETGGNDCGLTVSSSGLGVSITRQGSAGLAAARTDGSCYGDTYDVIDFGYLPSGILGRTCTQYLILPFADDRINEADVRLNVNAGWFQYLPAACSNRYELAGVLTHEFGHVFGMGHVDESTHGQLTMSTNATPCSYADHSLGLGDYNNLHDHY